MKQASSCNRAGNCPLWRQTLAPALASVLGAIFMSGCNTIGKPSGSAGQISAPVFDIPHLPAIGIDGQPDDWGAAGFRVDTLVPDKESMPARKEFAAGLRLGWNDSGLLVLLEVTGRDWSESEKITELFSRDSVEFYLARYPGSRERCQWLVAPGMDARFPEPRVNLQDFATTPKLLRNAIAPTVARVRTDDGYRMEVLLPWQTLGVAPERGEGLGFQVMVNSHDRKGRRADHLLWFPMLGAAFDSRKLHRIRLADRPSPPVTARARVRVDRPAGKIECDVVAPLAADGRAVRLRTANGVLASGTLGARANGFAGASLAGPGTDDPVAYLDVNGELADVVPLTLPRAGMSIETRVRLRPSTKDLTVVLRLPDAPPPGYRVMRRLPGEAWTVLATNAPPGEFIDSSLKKEALYEFGISRDENPFLTDYFWTGCEIPLRDRRGTVLLLVERSLAEPLASQIRRLVFDLLGDGWQVRRRDVLAAQSPAEIREWILAEYKQSPAEVSHVLLLGHVPVPYAGHTCPDGHPDHGGAWPADVYYGALDGDWTDTVVSNHSNGVQLNVPGDGKLDQAQIPGRVQLAVGRVDFADMPAFRVGETNLLRAYLDRAHAYRHALLPVADRGLVQDGFPGHPERFAYSGWQNLTTLLPPASVLNAAWPNVTPGRNLLFSGCGPGGHTGMKDFGDAAALVKTPLEAVFTTMFGSYFGDWNTTDNFMRAVLAHERGALTCGWAGRPHWYLHSMGMGETVGDCLRRTQNNDGSDYKPAGSHARGIHMALLGDPTLRLHPVAPPADLRVQAVGRGIRLSWAASPRQVTGYQVYRANAEFGPYERITKEPVRGTTVDDPGGTAAHYYQIRAVVLHESTTGTYYNSSQGIFAGPPSTTPDSRNGQEESEGRKRN